MKLTDLNNNRQLAVTYFIWPAVCTVCQSVIFVTSSGIITITTVAIVHHQSPTNEPPTANGPTSLLALTAGEVECCLATVSCGSTSCVCLHYGGWSGSLTLISGKQMEGKPLAASALSHTEANNVRLLAATSFRMTQIPES
jgi:hypothetical protein